MKVEISNLGVIKKAEIDLKPLTVFIGGNGTGKTWTAYTLASIFSKYGFQRYLKTYIDGKTQHRYSTLDNAIELFLQEGSTQIDLVKFVEEYAETYINDVAQLAPSWMKTFLATERVDFEKLNVRFFLDVKQQICDKIKQYSLERQINFGSQHQNSLRVIKEKGEDNIYFYIVSENNIFKKLPNKVFRKILIEVTLEVMHQTLYSYVYIFPTERTIITFPSLQKEIGKLESIDYNNLESIEIEPTGTQKTEPLQSFALQNLIEILASALIKTSERRQEEIQAQPKISTYVQLSELLENHLLQGKVDFDSSRLEHQILFQPADGIKLEMQVTSSMVKELTSLVLCLRYLVEPDELLIIDEPEMNLHPVAQVEIIEFLAMLVQAGLKILITTHSPYIVDHLTNLIQAAKHNDKESIKERFYLERTEAFIPQDKVSVYLFEDGTARNILDKEGRIDWETFGDVSDDISHIFP